MAKAAKIKFAKEGITVNGTLAVTGATTLTGAITTSGALGGATLAVTGNGTVGGTLGVTGLSTLASLAVTGAATVGTTLGVTGAATLSGSLAVTGLATFSSTVTNDGGYFRVTDKTQSYGWFETGQREFKRTRTVLEAGNTATYNLNAIDSGNDVSFRIVTDSGTTTVTFTSTDFVDYAAATDAEVKVVIDAAVAAGNNDVDVVVSSGLDLYSKSKVGTGWIGVLGAASGGDANDATNGFNFTTSLSGRKYNTHEDTTYGPNGSEVTLVTKSAVMDLAVAHTLTGFIPAGACVMSLTARNLSALTGDGTWDGTATYDLGVASGDTDEWGSGIAAASGTTIDATDWTSGTVPGVVYASASDVAFAETAGTASGGEILIVMHYLLPVAPTS